MRSNRVFKFWSTIGAIGFVCVMGCMLGLFVSIGSIFFVDLETNTFMPLLFCHSIGWMLPSLLVALGASEHAYRY